MILQYKGFNNNWCYEEAETIIYATVLVGKVTSKYRNGGAEYKNKYANSDDTEVIGLSYVNKMREEVDNLIVNETGCSDEIVYLINKPFDEMENVTVVTLNDKCKNTTYVFDSDVYLLNSKGQTVQRLA